MSTAKKLESEIRSKNSRHPGTHNSAPVLEKRQGQRVPSGRLNIADQEELAKLGGGPDPSDPNFQSELNYDGYGSIEESDNGSYNSRDLEKKDNATHELVIEDREEDSDMGEEDPLDPQENRK